MGKIASKMHEIIINAAVCMRQTVFCGNSRALVADHNVFRIIYLHIFFLSFFFSDFSSSSTALYCLRCCFCSLFFDCAWMHQPIFTVIFVGMSKMVYTHSDAFNACVEITLTADKISIDGNLDLCRIKARKKVQNVEKCSWKIPIQNQCRCTHVFTLMRIRFHIKPHDVNSWT